jgi:hydroxyacylglutathione hydrolase
MIIEKFPQTPFQQNTRIVACEKTRRAICIDPGEHNDDMLEYIRSNALELQAITLTHGHLDHVGGTKSVNDAFPDAEVLLHKGDEHLYYGLPQQPLMMGVPEAQLEMMGMKYDAPPTLARNWEHGEIYEVGELRFSIRHCPGHTPGHVVFAELTEQKVFVGDCLFYGSVGRSDLPGGDHDQLMGSINEQIVSLGDDFTVYSGHGPETTVGRERRQNPFLNGTYQMTRGRYI